MTEVVMLIMSELANTRVSMRSLRSSLASSSLSAGTGRTVRQTEPVTAYTSVPRQRLNLVDSQVGRRRWGVM